MKKKGTILEKACKLIPGFEQSIVLYKMYYYV